MGCAALDRKNREQAGHKSHEQAGRKTAGHTLADLDRHIRAVVVGRHIVAGLDSPDASRRRRNNRRWTCL